MRICCLCGKIIKDNNAIFFTIPRDERKRKKWSEACGVQLSTNDGICGDHFSSTDIIKERRKFVLRSNAVPLALPVKNEANFFLKKFQSKTTQDTDLDKTINDKTGLKCRCCRNPSSNFIQLNSYVKRAEGNEKTYKDLLYELTNLSISIYHENFLPQQVCQKCGDQIKGSHNFIQQACIISEEYISLIDQQIIPKGNKKIEYLDESLIEIKEPIGIPASEEFKVEPLNVENNMKIKEELECELSMPTIFHNDGSQEERDLLENSNTDEHSTDEENSDVPESEKVDTDLKNEPVARRCDICHKVYRNEKFLKVHKRYTHMPEENKLPCPLCSYKASRTSALKVHMGLVHGHDKINEFFKPVMDSGKKYPCNLCPRSYGRKDSLRKHVRRKHVCKQSNEDIPKKLKTSKPKEKQRFLCTYCGQSYSSKSGLESHALTHTGERPFSCEVCSKTFKRLKDLQLHRVIHSDEKPYQCSQCGKAFKRIDKLKIHMRVHSELRPYKCNECEKAFKYPSVLRTHMHIHTGQTPFHCKTCGEAFSLRTSLNNHCLKNGHAK